MPLLNALAEIFLALLAFSRRAFHLHLLTLLNVWYTFQSLEMSFLRHFKLTYNTTLFLKNKSKFAYIFYLSMCCTSIFFLFRTLAAFPGNYVAWMRLKTCAKCISNFWSFICRLFRLPSIWFVWKYNEIFQGILRHFVSEIYILCHVCHDRWIICFGEFVADVCFATNLNFCQYQHITVCKTESYWYAVF